MVIIVIFLHNVALVAQYETSKGDHQRRVLPYSAPTFEAAFQKYCSDTFGLWSTSETMAVPPNFGDRSFGLLIVVRLPTQITDGRYFISEII